MNKRIFFRADASTKVGWGHLTRCLSLASMLKENFSCTFILKDSADFAFNLLEESKFSFLKLGEADLTEEASEVAALLTPGDILLIDGYQFTEDYYKTIKNSGAALALIDDFVKASPLADVLINHAVDLSENDFENNNKIRFATGEKYAMLRPPFLKMAQQQRQISSVKNVFICFGGADNNNVTLKVVQAIKNSGKGLKFHLVLASTFPYTNAVKEFLQSTSLQWEIHSDLNADQMAVLMQDCEIAIAPTSGLSYEICAVGMGYLGGYYIDNQIGIHNGFLKRNCFLSLNDFTKVSTEEIRQGFEKLVNDISLINEVIANQKKTIDGKSSDRFIELFSSL
jgi:UDP-2,4-diacetamido-2,4,6-trideoxy-beta-L-altropyranose hydrolase